jgi:F-type H+-transporting ATPase subunit epsilon
VVSFRQKEGGGRLAVNRGYVEVLDDAVTVLTHTAESPNDIDCARARRALERGRRRLAAAARDPGIDVVRAEYAVRRALARLAAAGEAAVQ